MENKIALALLTAYLGLSSGCDLIKEFTGEKPIIEKSKTNAPQQLPVEKAAKPKVDNVEEKLRNIVLSYASDPQFSGSGFLSKITGTSIKLELYDLDKERIYLSVPSTKYNAETLNKLAKDQNQVSFARNSDGSYQGTSLKLEGLILNRPGNYFFAMPAENLRIDKKARLNINLGGINYNPSLQELSDLLSNKKVYGGSLFFNSSPKVSANHGAYVAKKGEPSLTRLISKLIERNDNIGRRAQKLLDFVTGNMKYNYGEANGDVEVLKRPNEVLMTRGSDCSGLVILYASLLEQAGIDYKIIYSNTLGHVTVAVEGNYENTNGLTFNFGKNYSIAETTVKGFIIGQTSVKPTIELKDITYFQKPGNNSFIYDGRTGNTIDFL